MTAPIAEAPIGRLVRAMVGRDLADFYPPRAVNPPGAPRLVVRGGANDHLVDIDLTVRAGEIVGVAGLEGAGKSALGRAIAGDEPFAHETGFDLSGGSLVTLTVVGASMLTANDPGNTWWAIAVLYAIGLLVGLTNGAVVAYQTALIAECPPDTKVQPDCPLPMGRLVEERGIEPHGKPAVCMPSF